MKRANFKRAKILRQKNALTRLEAAYEKFKAAGKDKESRTSTSRGGKRVIFHPGRTFNEECERMKQEIANLKQNISKNHS